MPVSARTSSLRPKQSSNTKREEMMKMVFAALLAVLFAGSAWADDKVTLMLNWYVYGEHAPFYYGKEKGYFKDAGIDLEIQEGRGSGTVTQVVAAKTVQFGYVDVPT